MMENEIVALKTLDHPNIVKVIEFFQDREHFFIVTEFVGGGDLYQRIVRKRVFREAEAAFIMRQVLSAVHYCHQKKIIHRDLKPENIMLAADESLCVKIIDFGCARLFDPTVKLKTRIGTTYYIAPEVLK